jgi:A/G-specific adenine glycosylase
MSSAKKGGKKQLEVPDAAGILPDLIDLVSRYTSGDLSHHRFDAGETLALRQRLLQWYHKNRRKLPWRGDDHEGVKYPFPNPYGTWVSEVMCQQTRVETVIPYWVRWMRELPTVEALAGCTPEKINSLWAGLGYYRRAQMLLKGAQKICSDLGGKVPSIIDGPDGLLAVPGIGKYTAGAIASIAFETATGAVDGNVIRVLSRLRAINYISNSLEMNKITWELANAIVDPKEPGSFNQSLMELGATICKPTSPDCTSCPLNKICYAKALVDYNSSHSKKSSSSSSTTTTTTASSSMSSKKSIKIDSKSKPTGGSNSEVVDLLDIEDIALPSDVTEFPKKAAKKKPRELHMSVVSLVWIDPADAVPRYLVIRRPQGGLLGGQWEFPNVTVWDSETENNKRKLASKMKMKANLSKAGSKGSKGSKSIDKEEEIEEGDEVEEDDDDPLEAPEMSESELLMKLQQYMSDTLGLEIALNSRTSMFEMKLLPSSTQHKYYSNITWSFNELKAEKQSILHIFSHQRHNMHLFSASITSFKSESSKDIASAKKGGHNNANTLMALHNDSDKNSSSSSSGGGGGVADIEDDRHWLSRGADSRVVKWLTEAELNDAGLTTGCKKVLDKANEVQGISSSSSSESKPSKQSKQPKQSQEQAAGSKRKISDFFVKGSSK